jgi:hypothetical protein
VAADSRSAGDLDGAAHAHVGDRHHRLTGFSASVQ